MSFVHLHTHTSYSLLDGISKREDLIEKCKQDGMRALAVTDHGALYNHIGFYRNCVKAGVQPILGIEAYVAPDSMKNRTYVTKGKLETGDISAYAYHLILLAKNLTGYHNLTKLSTAAWRDGFYRKPRIDLDILNQHREGLIVLSGCVGSMTSQAIIQGRKDLAEEYIDKFRFMFGEDFYLELMHHEMPEDRIVSEALIEFSQKKGIGTVITNDSHFTHEHDAMAHEVALCLNTHKTMHDSDRWTFPGSGYWFKTSEEMARLIARAGYPEDAYLNSLHIAKKIEDYGFKLGKHMIPLFRDRQGVQWNAEDSHQKLVMACMNGMAKLGLTGQDKYDKRLEMELETIEKKHFSSYFLIIADIINFIRTLDTIPPFGRGSSVGSLVCYTLGITAMDPEEWSIPFYRFINPGRKDLPDIDTDISKKHRKAVIDYIVRTYGEDHVAQIVTFQSMLAKKAIDDAGSALGVPSPIRKMVSKQLGDDITKDDSIEELLADNREAASMMEQHKYWADIAKKLEGVHRNTSVHAAGVVISNEPIDRYVPLMKDHEGYRVTQFDMIDVQDLGLLKLDMLGLRTIDTIHETTKFVKQTIGKDIDVFKIPLDDPKTYQLITEGNFVSVFQYDSSGFREMARRLKPDKFEYLMALNALYRPGPMLPQKVMVEKSKNTFVEVDAPSIADTYIACRLGQQAVASWHPALDEIMANTFGMPLYQEQISEMSKKLSNFDDMEADEYRAAIGKKDKVKFEAAQKKFTERGVANGHTQDFMSDIAKKLGGFARYGWNRGHAAGYSRISYITAYLEAHYPVEYYTALLNTNIDKAENLTVLLSGIMQKGIEIKPPDVNVSRSEYSTDGKNIYMGLYSVRQMGVEANLAIMWERERGGPFAGYIDFVKRVSQLTPIATSHPLFKEFKQPIWDRDKHGDIPDTYNLKSVPSSVIENLIKAGSFSWDDTMPDKDKTACLEKIQKLAKRKKKIENFEFTVIGETVELRFGKEYDKLERSALEREALNFYVSGHPVSNYTKFLGIMASDGRIITPSQVQNAEAKESVVILGLLQKKEMKMTKNNKPYLQVRVQDQFGEVVMRVWDPLAQQIWPLIQEGSICVVRGGIENDKFREGMMDVYVRNLYTVTGGLPIKGFKADTDDLILSVCRHIGVVPTAVIPVAGWGIMAHLSEPLMMTPDALEPLRGYDNLKLMLAS
jgi:DNA polymerase-3 subunit alpha